MDTKAWWYATKKDERQGPHPASHLQDLYRSGALSDNALVWTKGMASWAKLSTVPELSSPDPSLPPPIPEATRPLVPPAILASHDEPPKSDPRAAATLGKPAKQAPVSPQLGGANVSDHSSRKPMHLAAYLGLCFVAWLGGALLANGVSVLAFNAYVAAVVPTIIGFWAGKAALRNKRRDWGGIIAFPVITFVAGILGFAIGQQLVSQIPGSMNHSALISLVIAFGLSCGLFAVLKNSHPR